jgi:hypothetical protein
MNIKGQLTISRWKGNDDTEGINIELIDADSHVRFVVVNISLEDFAKAITGLGYVPVDLDVRGLDKVGKIAEFKSTTVPVPFVLKYEDDFAALAREHFYDNPENEDWFINISEHQRFEWTVVDGVTYITVNAKRFLDRFE